MIIRLKLIYLNGFLAFNIRGVNVFQYWYLNLIKINNYQVSNYTLTLWFDMNLNEHAVRLFLEHSCVSL